MRIVGAMQVSVCSWTRISTFVIMRIRRADYKSVICFWNALTISLSHTLDTYQGMSETTEILVLPVSLANSKRTSVQPHVIIVNWAPTHLLPVQRQSTRAQTAPRFLPRSRGKAVLPVTATLDTLGLTSARASHANKENTRISPALLPAKTVLLAPTCFPLAPALQAPACLAQQDRLHCPAALP